MENGPFEKIIRIYYQWENAILGGVDNGTAGEKYNVMDFHENEAKYYKGYESKMKVMFAIKLMGEDHEQQTIRETMPRLAKNNMVFSSHEALYIRSFQEDTKL